MADPDRWAPAGFHVLRGFASEHECELAEVCAGIARAAPWHTPVMHDGTPFRCEVTGAGAGVFSSTRARGYHYTRYTENGHAWPKMPRGVEILAMRALHHAGESYQGSDSMLLNRYDASQDQRLGLHNDTDEAAIDAPIVTISLGADCEFLVGGLERGDPVDSTILSSGDVIVMARQARLWHHGVKRVMPVLVSPLERGVRICMSVRKVYL